MKFCTLGPTLSHFLLPPGPGTHHSTHCLYVFDYFGFHIWARSCKICLCVSAYLTYSILSSGPSVLWQMGRFPFSRLNDIPLYTLSCSYLYILGINPLSDTWSANIFFHFVGCLFILLIVSLATKKLFRLIVPTVYFCFCWVFAVTLKITAKTIPYFPTLFSTSSFTLYSLIFKSLIHFELFLCSIRQMSNFILLHENIQFSQPHLLKRQTSFYWVFVAPLSNIIDCMYRGLFLGSQFCSTVLCVCFYASIIVLWLL